MITLFEENETLMQIGMPDARTPNRPLIARPTTRTDSPTYKPKSSSKIPAKIKKYITIFISFLQVHVIVTKHSYNIRRKKKEKKSPRLKY